MAIFLVDENLPLLNPVWKNSNFIHQKEISGCNSDNDIWNYAKDNNLTIVTKDSDFSHRILVSTPPPKVIHIKLGNMPLSKMHALIGKCWPTVLEYHQHCKLVRILNGLGEGID